MLEHLIALTWASIVKDAMCSVKAALSSSSAIAGEVPEYQYTNESLGSWLVSDQISGRAMIEQRIQMYARELASKLQMDGSPLHPEVAELVNRILTVYPALAREINVALATDDVAGFYTSCAKSDIRWLAAIGEWVCAFASRKARLKRTDPYYSVLDSAATRLTSCAATLIAAVRQVLGLYARLTYNTSPALVPFDPAQEYSLAKQQRGDLWWYRSTQICDLPSVAKRPSEVIAAFKERITAEAPHRTLSLACIGKVIFQGYRLHPEDDNVELRFAHGPGSVAEGFDPLEKGKYLELIRDDRIEALVTASAVRPLFPSETGARASYTTTFAPRSLKDYVMIEKLWLDPRLEASYHVTPEGNQWLEARNGLWFEGRTASRVCLVPKDYRGPRVIAAEPCLHQYVQQGLMRSLVSWIPRSPLADAIALDAQELNQHAARVGSLTGAVATIDLSDASDTVRMEHLKSLLRFRPDLLLIYSQVRTTAVSLPGGEDVEDITTAFPMGSALCFPIESVVFTAVLLAEAAAYLPGYAKRKWSRALVKELIRYLRLRAYGDDIIIRTDMCEWALSVLESWGFKPNRSKCCRGHVLRFRESCGCDYVWGHDITPLRPRNLPGGSEFTLEALIATLQNVCDRGYFNLAITLYGIAAKEFSYRVPILPEPLTALEARNRVQGCVYSSCLFYSASKEIGRKGRFTVAKACYGEAGADSERRLRESLMSHAIDIMDPPAPFKGWPTRRAPVYKHAKAKVPDGTLPRVLTDEDLNALGKALRD